MPRECSAKHCTNTFSQGSTVYYCCSPITKYCSRCKQQHRCSKCMKYPQHKLTYFYCENCGGKTRLLRCGCKRITCETCELNANRCYSCKQEYMLVEEQKNNGSPEKYRIKCQYCDRLLASCVCKSRTASNKKTEKQRCNNCFYSHETDDLFCNLCGHLYCRKCITTLEKCRALYCANPQIDQSLLHSFLGGKNCELCEKPLSKKMEERFGPDKNICRACKEFISEVEPIPEEPKPQAPKTKENQKKNEGNKNIDEGKEIERKRQSLDSKEKQVPKPDKQSSDKKTNSYANGIKNDDKISKSPNNIIQKNPQQKVPQNNAITEPKTPQKNSNILENPKQQPSGLSASPSSAPPCMACTSCSLPLPPKHLFPISCAQKHPMCGYCALLHRTSKCPVCTRQQQQHLDKYFSYKQLTSAQGKASYELQLAKDRMAFCWLCSVIVESTKVIEEKGKGYCRACLLKVK